MHRLWGLGAGACVSTPHIDFPRKLPLQLAEVWVWAPPSHHEVNRNAGCSLAAPEGEFRTLGGVHAGCRAPRLGAPHGLAAGLLSVSPVYSVGSQISELKRTPRREQPRPRSPPARVHVGASVRAHPREPRSPARPPVAALVATLAALGRLGGRHMKDFMECEDREQRQKAEGGGCRLCSRGGMRKC